MNILVIKTGAIGDVLRTSFIAQALKERYSKREPRIFWITDKNAAPLLINNPYVDNIILKENKNSINNIAFEEVINLEEDEEYCKFVNLLNTNKVIGFRYKENRVIPTPTAREWFNMSALGEKPANNILKSKNRKTHRQIIGEIIGVNWRKYEPFLRLNSTQRKITDNFMRRHNLSREEMIIGINTGAADRWPKALSIKKTAQLIDGLYKRFNARILLFGGPNEIERNKEIIQISKSPIIDTGCGNDLREFPALISACNFFITSDSLGLHIALALKRRTLCLTGPTSHHEIDMYGLGEKIVSNSSCTCCYKKGCKSMEKISIKKVFTCLKRLQEQKIILIITAFKEPNISKAIRAALEQKTSFDYEIIVSAPDSETLDIAKSYAKTNKNLRIFRDPGKGKSYALNLLFKKINSDILILTDGDVLLSKNAVEEVVAKFNEPEIGCVTGRPVPMENKKTKYGYWANFLFESAHRLRKNSSERGEFIECSAYLFAFRGNKINSIPLDVAEDSVMPYYFWERGYKIGYAEKAEVYVKNTDNLRDWMKQKTRTGKAHETLKKYVNTTATPRVKTFGTEAKGITWLMRYPSSLKEGLWTLELALARVFMWAKVAIDTKIIGKHYGDAWERVESTK